MVYILGSFLRLLSIDRRDNIVLTIRRSIRDSHCGDNCFVVLIPHLTLLISVFKCTFRKEITRSLSQRSRSDMKDDHIIEIYTINIWYHLLIGPCDYWFSFHFIHYWSCCSVGNKGLVYEGKILVNTIIGNLLMTIFSK